MTIVISFSADNYLGWDYRVKKILRQRKNWRKSIEKLRENKESEKSNLLLTCVAYDDVLE